MRLASAFFLAGVALAALPVAAQPGTQEVLRVTEWHGSFTVTESGTITGRTSNAEFNTSITTTAQTSSTCSGNVQLTREEGDRGSWSGEAEVTCSLSNGFERVQTTHGVVARMGHETSGGGSGSQRAWLYVDPEGGMYAFHVDPLNAEVTVREFMDGHSELRTETQRLGLGGLNHLVEDQPLPGDAALSGALSVPMELMGYVGGVSGERSGEMTRTITWTLSPGRREEDVRVAIQGPVCACLDAEDEEATVAFTATASEGGGTFEPFVVSASGSAPREVANEGGTDPVLELAPTRETEAVTLSISYEKGRERYTSDPFPVSFCTIEEPSIEGGVTDFSFDASADGRLEVNASARAWHDGEDVSSDLLWRLERMDGGPRREPEEAAGARASLAYVGLPEHNDAFGPKDVTARLERGACACERDAEIRTFFPLEASNHPPGQGGTGADRTGNPNWFYYWLQTGAARTVEPGRVFHRAVIPTTDGSRVTARYDRESDRIFITNRVLNTEGCQDRVDRATKQPLGVRAQMFDCFAEMLRHEWQHRTEEFWWWNPYDPTQDPDLDGVPISVEDTEPGCSNFSQKSCDAIPFPDDPYISDSEIYAYYTGWTWEVGTEDSSDWSCGGKQWQGGTCPD